MSTATDIADILAHVAKGGDPEEATRAILESVARARRHASWDAGRVAGTGGPPVRRFGIPLGGRRRGGNGALATATIAGSRARVTGVLGCGG